MQQADFFRANKALATIALSVVTMAPGLASAEYIAVGPFQGEVCSGFIIKACGHRKLDAVEKDGKFFEINRVWPRVDEYKPPKNGSLGLCFIKLKEGLAANFGGRLQLYSYSATGRLEKVEVESYIRFNCRKQ